MLDHEILVPSELFDDRDRTGPIPPYFQVSSRLETAIRDGVIPSGARLENEVEIPRRLGLRTPPYAARS